MTTVFCIVGTVLLISESSFTLTHSTSVPFFTVERGLNTLQNVRQKGKRYLEEILASFQDSESDDVIGSKESMNKAHQYPNLTYANSIWKRDEMHKVLLHLSFSLFILLPRVVIGVICMVSSPKVGWISMTPKIPTTMGAIASQGSP